MAGEDKDPNEGLAQDAAVAADLGDEKSRQEEQLSYYGGELDDIDNEDLSAVDRGDVIEEESDDESEEKQEGDEEVSDDTEAEDGDVGEGEEDGEADADGSDDSSEESAEPDEDGEDDDEPADEVRDKGIPRHRFNEVNQRMKEAEARLAAIEAKEVAVEEAIEAKYDFDTAEAEYVDLLLDGKTKEAAQKRSEIRAAEKAEYIAEAKTEAVRDFSRVGVEQTVVSLSQEAEQMFPAFDQNSDEFNPEAVEKTLTFMRGYQSSGMQADDAFVAALADTITIYGLAAPDEATEQQGDEEPKNKVTKKAPIKKTADKIKLAEKQAKSPVGQGKPSASEGLAVPNVMDMTDEELDRLDDATIAKLRGDYV